MRFDSSIRAGSECRYENSARRSVYLYQTFDQILYQTLYQILYWAFYWAFCRAFYQTSYQTLYQTSYQILYQILYRTFYQTFYRNDLTRFLDHQKERSNQIFIFQHDASSTKFSRRYDHEISSDENKKSKLAYSWSRCSTTRIIARSRLDDATMQFIDLAEFYWYLN